MTEHRRLQTRLGLAYLTATFLPLGLWATFATRSFYDDFPGFGRRWVAGDGPYNAHLASDAGVGFLAVGVVMLLAAIWMERRLVQAALVAAFLHGLLHLFFHLVHPKDDVGSLDALLSNGGLLVGVVLAAILLVTVTRTPATSGSREPLPELLIDTSGTNEKKGLQSK
jgi:hypothetical protein